MSQVDFYPETSNPWPHGCPCCGANLKATDSDMEQAWWEWHCGCSLIYTTVIEINQPCPDAMEHVLEGMTVHQPEPVPL